MEISIPEALKELGVGRTKLYGLFKQLNITPNKQGNKSFLNLQQVESIREFLKESVQSEQSAQSEQSQKTTGSTEEKAFYTDRITQLETELAEERQNNKDLVLQVGQWQGRAKTLEEQNQKLLEAPRPIEAEEAEILEAETEEKPKSKGWFSFFRRN